MVASADTSSALGTTGQLHGHTAIADRELQSQKSATMNDFTRDTGRSNVTTYRMAVRTLIPVARVGGDPSSAHHGAPNGV